MKKMKIAFFVATSLAFLACSHNPKLQDQEMFRSKTGVIGVFRQPAFYCSEATPQYITLGDSNVLVKPTWSEEQDNVFVTEQKPGEAKLYSYQYTCGENETKLTLDSAGKGSVGVVVPESGFCKVVISFVQGDKLFSYNDALLLEMFEKEKVAWPINRIPNCEIIDNSGKKVSMADKDSILQAKYNAAVLDAADALEEEIQRLVVINSQSDEINWNINKDKVLMVTMHKGEKDFNLGAMTVEREIWTVADKELVAWYKANKDKVKDMPLRMKQLMGLPPTGEHAYFTAFWVDPKDIIRPAFSTNVQVPDMKTAFDDEGETEIEFSETKKWFRIWFDKNRSRSYVKRGGFPWTRLGYTYDWSKVGTSESKYGLSEFLIVPGAEVDVIFTKNLKTFQVWMDDKKE